MNTLLLLGDGLIGLVAVAVATLLTALLLRNPLGPKWLRSEGAGMAASLGITTAVVIASAYAVQSFVDAGLHHIEAAIGTVGVLVASLLVSWKIFHVGERLRHADAGRSPFQSITRETSIPQSQAQTRR
jgi:hypothetical protein